MFRKQTVPAPNLDTPKFSYDLSRKSEVIGKVGPFQKSSGDIFDINQNRAASILQSSMLKIRTQKNAFITSGWYCFARVIRLPGCSTAPSPSSSVYGHRTEKNLR